MFYPTAKELAILKALNKYRYMTSESVCVATGQSYRGAVAKLAHLAPKETPENKNAVRYAWRIARHTTEQNLPLKPAYCLAQNAKRYLEQLGIEVILPSRTPNDIFLSHYLTVVDILVRVEAFWRGSGRNTTL